MMELVWLKEKLIFVNALLVTKALTANKKVRFGDGCLLALWGILAPNWVWHFLS
jgi:hypothetical protein